RHGPQCTGSHQLGRPTRWWPQPRGPVPQPAPPTLTCSYRRVSRPPRGGFSRSPPFPYHVGCPHDPSVHHLGARACQRGGPMSTVHVEHWSALAKCRGTEDILFCEGAEQKRARLFC